MTYDEFNDFCKTLPAARHVVQWGGSQVWKIGDKIFAVGGWGEDCPAYTFKVSDISYEMLKTQSGLRPAPYLASRGMTWIQHYASPGLNDADLKNYIARSYRIVSDGLTKKTRRELGLEQS